MSDPRNRGAAAPVPTKGEGCTRRFDPDAMSVEHGADFGDAASLWRALQEQVAATDSDGTTPAAETLPSAGKTR